MGSGDMFLRIEGSRQGVIKGESGDRDHKGEIDVLRWSWGMEGNALHGGKNSMATARELKVLKTVDSASTALMSALRNNEVLKKAVLSVRKAGGASPVEYFKIELENARITSLVVESGQDDDPAALTEQLSLAFDKLTAQYRAQGADGVAKGTSEFVADFADRK